MSAGSSHELPRAFGPYELVRQLGVGGMAEVYVARARSVAGFEKVVALKTIHTRFSSDPEFTQLLVDEANITAQLSHRNIVQVIDLGQIDGTHYIAMEYVDGLDLGRLLTTAKERKMLLSPRVAAYVCREVADGLEHAHKKTGSDGKPLRIVHRDISPPNILVSTAGEVKITDFGIAKASLRASKTAAGVVKGKYAYMSPEQAKALSVDHRADIFALGCVLYELATGRPVYPDLTLPVLLDRVARAAFEAPERLRPGLPAKLVEAIKKCLAPKPEDRFQSARQVADALTDVLFTMPPNPDAELAIVVSELSGTPSTPSIPPVVGGPSILDDDFDDSTQIESMSVMRSRMTPNPAVAAPSTEKPTFRDEATRAFKRVETPQPGAVAVAEDGEDATAAMSSPFRGPDPRAVPTMAPPAKSAGAAKVKSPGAAAKTAPPPPRPNPPPPSVSSNNAPGAVVRDAPTMAPPAKTKSTKPEAPPPKAPAAPFIAKVEPLATSAPAAPKFAPAPPPPATVTDPPTMAIGAPLMPQIPPAPSLPNVGAYAPTSSAPPMPPSMSQPTPSNATGPFATQTNPGHPPGFPAPTLTPTPPPVPYAQPQYPPQPAQPSYAQQPYAQGYPSSVAAPVAGAAIDPFAQPAQTLDLTPEEPRTSVGVLVAGGFALLGLVALVIVFVVTR
ncbi:MAG: protein kinase [Myxococcales bacterium]|nr:protein kinase [Myxococcales bacterium]